jgi:predicted transcriptional regulator
MSGSGRTTLEPRPSLLRRHMCNHLLNARVDDIMTHRTKTVRPDRLISKTLGILNSTKVTRHWAAN